MDRDEATTSTGRTALLPGGRPEGDRSGVARAVPPSSGATSRGGDAARVRQALAGLEPLDREVVVLHFRDGLSVQRIASLTESTPEEVTRRLRRGADAVETASGPSVGIGVVPLDDRDEDEAVADIALGITPQLAWRLQVAVTTGEVQVLSPTTVSRRRLRMESWLHEHAGSLLNVAAVAGTATVVAVTVVGPL